VERVSPLLEDCSRESRRRRKRFHEAGDLQRASKVHGMQHLASRRQEILFRNQKRPGDNRGPRRVFAARHRAWRQSAHVVPAIHRSRILGLRWRLLVMMMRRDVAESPDAAVRAISQECRPGHRRIQKRHRQQAQTCGSPSNALLSFRSHKDRTHSNDTPLRRFFEPPGGQTFAPPVVIAHFVECGSSVAAFAIVPAPQPTPGFPITAVMPYPRTIMTPPAQPST
jgi:hypothetical protein